MSAATPVGSPVELALRDIHLPPAPDFWPPAWGWWVLAAVSLGLCAWFGVWLWREARWRLQRARLLALLGEFERAAPDQVGPEFLAGISRLLRRIALRRYPAHEIAALSGEAWLRFLDRSGGGGGFQRGPGSVLAEGPYMPALNKAVDRPALVALVRSWIDLNSGRGRRV